MKYTRRSDSSRRNADDLNIIGSRNQSRPSRGELSSDQFLFEDFDLNEDLGGTGSSAVDRLYGGAGRSSDDQRYTDRRRRSGRQTERRRYADNQEARPRQARRQEAGSPDERPRQQRSQDSIRQENSTRQQRIQDSGIQEDRPRQVRRQEPGTQEEGRRTRNQAERRPVQHSESRSSARSRYLGDHDPQTASSSGKRSSGKRKGGKSQKTLKKDIFAIILLALQGALSIALIVVMSILDVLPAGYFILMIAILLILWGIVFFTQFKRYKKLPLIGKIFSIILCIVLIVGNYYMIITNKAIDTVTEEVAYDIDYIDVVVMANDPAQKIEDAADYTFGTQATFQPINLNTALNDIEEAIGKEPKTKDYNSALNQVDALYNGEVKAIIYNRDFRPAMIERHEKYEEETRVIMTITIKEAVDIKSQSNVDVTTQPFLFYISGNDEYGEISISGRTDVNMLIAVNPVSRQVLMINTPRDYYVEFPGVSGGIRDKLTHSGVYGMQCQVDTMSELYGYDVDYYCKVNFSSLIDIVNALDGIDLYNPYEFQFSYSDTVFPEGYIHLDGWPALEYCRERESLEGGDNERGRHQQMVIEAIINKLLSSAGFTAYSQLIKTLEKCCITNIPKESISALVKKQLAEGGGWTITKASAEGEGMLQATFSMGEMGLYVTMPYTQSIRNIQEMLRALYAGEEVVALQMSEDDDHSLIAEPGPVPEEIADEEEESTTPAEEETTPAEDGGEETTTAEEGGEGGEGGEETTTAEEGGEGG